MLRIAARTGAWFGFAAVAAWVALYLVAALSTPGYTITGNRLSDLGNPSQPAPWAFNSACILAGLFFFPFAWGLGAGMTKWMRGVGSVLLSIAATFLVLLGIFHEGSPYNLHFIFSGLFFILFMMAISHYAVGMWRNPRYGPISGILSFLASGFALLFIIAAVVESATGIPLAGGVLSNVLEHVTVFAGLAWAVWNAFRLHRVGAARRSTGAVA
jgi:hypothetical membrane protein